jgi:hypothetical protein
LSPVGNCGNPGPWEQAHQSGGIWKSVSVAVLINAAQPCLTFVVYFSLLHFDLMAHAVHVSWSGPDWLKNHHKSAPGAQPVILGSEQPE